MIVFFMGTYDYAGGDPPTLHYFDDKQEAASFILDKITETIGWDCVIFYICRDWEELLVKARSGHNLMKVDRHGTNEKRRWIMSGDEEVIQLVEKGRK